MRRPPVWLTLLLALSLLMPWPAVLLAAVAHVATTEFDDGGASATTLVSGSISSTAGELLLMLVTGYTNTTSSVGESGGGTFTKHLEQQNGVGNSASCWSLPNASGGSHTYTVTFGGADLYDSAWLMRVSGAATSSAYEAGTSAIDNSGASSTPASGTFTTAGTSFLVGVQFGGNNPTTPGSGWTEPTNGESSLGNGSVEYKANPGTTSHTADFTTTGGGNWVAVGCGFTVAGAGGGRPCCRFSLLGVG